MTDELAAELRQALTELEARLDEIDERLVVVYAGLALARWLIALIIPVAAVIVAVWKG